MSTQIYPVRFGINRCYLIREEGVIMIDGGPPKKLKAFQKFIGSISIRPEDIRLIVLTHGDFDHVGSARDIKSLTGAKIAIHENDRETFEKALHHFPTGTTAWGRSLRFILNPVTKVLFKFPGQKADIVLDNSDYPLHEFGINGSIVFTPGHTSGSVSVLLESGDAFVGCLAHNNLPFRLKPGLPIFADDIEEVRKNWKKVIERGAKTIYPAHGEPFPVEVIKKILKY
jgi:hydroxyacylglutathione hydrolase